MCRFAKFGIVTKLKARQSVSSRGMWDELEHKAREDSQDCGRLLLVDRGSHGSSVVRGL
jgi:hypothetical protein